MINKNNIHADGKKIRWKYTPLDESNVDLLGSVAGVPRPVLEILAKKGFKSKLELDTFFNAPLSSIRNPFEIMNMEKAAERIAGAIQNHERICIYGDYDVDGITSTAALFMFLKEVGADVVYYIPNRLEEGYGLNIEAVREIAAKKVRLIVTVDCGISAEAEVAAAIESGMDVIVTDHHQPSANVPVKAYAIVNPLQEGDSYAYKSLAGVGVSFKLIMALRYVLKKRNYFKSEVPNIKNFLDIVTLGTIADVMPLTDENRIMVKQGLGVLSGSDVRVGIGELKAVTGIVNQQVKAYHVGFQLAPRINAMGRMGSSDKSIKLLLTSDRTEAKTLATELDNENKFRQTIEKEILDQTFEMIEKSGMIKSKKGIVLSAENWHPGVIGIVASRVVDRYFRPTVILSSDGVIAKGSARSIPSFHLYDGLSQLSDILVSFGGHKYAAGVKVSIDKVDEFSKRFNDVVSSKLTDEDLIPELEIDAVIKESDINIDTYNWLSKLEPYGSGNREPLFCLKNVTKYQPPTFVGRENSHLKCFFEKNGTVFDSIGYNMKSYSDLISDSNKFDILFTLAVNKWHGNTSIQLNLKDIRSAAQ